MEQEAKRLSELIQMGCYAQFNNKGDIEIVHLGTRVCFSRSCIGYLPHEDITKIKLRTN